MKGMEDQKVVLHLSITWMMLLMTALNISDRYAVSA